MISAPRSIRLAALVAIASLTFAACSSTTTSPSAEATAAPATAAPAVTDAPAPEVTPEPGTLPAPEQTDVSIGLSVTEVSQFAAVLASQLGLYEKYGLNVDYTVFEGDGKAVAALQSGQIDIAFTGTSSALSSQLTDVPYKDVAVNAMLLTDNLTCQGTIKSDADVAGKTIAISTFGGTSNAAALLSLKALGYAATDAVITQVGGQTARLAALTGGSIDCAIVDSNLEAEMIAQGFYIAVRLKEAGIEYGRSGMGVTEEYLAANPNTVLVALAAVLEAQEAIFTKPDVAIQAYASFRQIDVADATKQITDFATVGNRSLMWTDEAFNNARKTLAIINPDIIDVPVTDAFDRSFLEKLVSIGFYEKIGAPTP
ncbi:MAG: ABC transporter substrate-binding protein [Candidatus Limnocylindrales bacterium]|nr:ABC transporter substrate-binding protein [Candidatus Limnocylindrales bacterium]